MILHVLKHPDPKTLATCAEVAEGTPVPNGWEAMTVSEFSAWEAAEIAEIRDARRTAPDVER